MGLMDFIKGELIDVIEWTDDSRDTLSYRFPDEDKAIKNGAQLIVRESQQVQFVYLGEFGAYEKADMKSRAAYTRIVRDEAEKRGIGWAYWEFASTFGVWSPKTGNWIDPLRGALLQ